VARVPPPEEDRELVRRWKAGDESAFEEIVRKYQQTVFNVICHNIGYRNDVEDIAQKVFAKVYFSLAKFDNNRPFFPWLYRIAVNQSYDELRRLRRRKVLTFTELSLDETDRIEALMSKNAITPSSPEETRELQELLLKMLGQLPEQQRIAIVLRDLEDMPYEQMAQVLKCTEQAARLKVFRARSRLRELLEKSLRRPQKR
jgi:RNA polymerase sigma-70 factor (ECF subfamily)